MVFMLAFCKASVCCKFCLLFVHIGMPEQNFQQYVFWLIFQLTNRFNNASVFRCFSCALLTDPLFLQECCVCLSSYEDGAELSALPCNHHFHWTCITKWLRMNATCPLCKYNILKGSDSAWPTYADITSAHRLCSSSFKWHSQSNAMSLWFWSGCMLF